MTTEFTPITLKMFNCDICYFKCDKKSDWNRHILSSKHKNTTEYNQNNTKMYKCECGKLYSHRATLFNHRKRCIPSIENETKITNDKNENVDSSNNIVELLIKETIDIKNIIIDLVKSNTELQKQVLDVCKNSNTTIHNNSHNKTFNLQVFLNEECKDAMNLKDFVNSFKLQLSDLELVGDEGFINGMTKVIIAKLNLIEPNKRPFHCTDAKREIIYVKEDDVWVREGPENSKLAAAIKAIGHQNFFILKEYKALHPDCESTYSEYNDHYMNLIMKSAGCQKEDIAKVIKKLVKEIVIMK
jgi:hypothetical protein